MSKFLPIFAVAAFLCVSPCVTAQETAEEDPRVYLEADILTEDRENDLLIAEGNVEVQFADRVLKADRLVYNLTTRKIRAQGDVQIIDADGTVRFAEEVEVDEDLEDGYATNFTTRLPGNSVARASAAVRQANGVNQLENVIFTSCKICEESEGAPTWALRARQATQDPNSQRISYRDAVFEVGGVPVLYLPYFTHPDPSAERRSGLLFPNFGVSSTIGTFYKQPIFWSISEHQDITLSPQFNSKVNPHLEYNYRKRFYSGEIEFDGSIAYDFEFNSNGDRIFRNSAGRIVQDPDNFTGELFPSEESVRSHIFGSGRFDINEDWRWGFGVERASDKEYTRRYDIQGENNRRGIYTAQPRQLISQLYTVGQDKSFYAEGSLLSFQGLNTTANNDIFPTVVPNVFAERYFNIDDYGLVSARLSSTNIERDEGDDTFRVSAVADWETSSILPGGVVLNPFAEARTDFFDFTQVDTDTLGDTTTMSDTETRVAGHVGTVASWPLRRTGENFSVRIEPTIMAAWGETNIENVDLPNEDSVLFELDSSSLFEPNGVAGNDYWESGARLAAGLKAVAQMKGGGTIHGVVGRRWRGEADEAFTQNSNLAGKSSDYVVGGGFDFGRQFSFDSSVRIDDDFEIQRVDVSTNFDFWRIRGAIRYYRIGEDISISQTNPVPDEGVTIAGRFRVTENWGITYRRLRDIVDGRDTQHGFGIQYSDDCSVFRLEYVTKDIGSAAFDETSSINFRIGLKTLGSFGSDEFD